MQQFYIRMSAGVRGVVLEERIGVQYILFQELGTVNNEVVYVFLVFLKPPSLSWLEVLDLMS